METGKGYEERKRIICYVPARVSHVGTAITSNTMDEDKMIKKLLTFTPRMAEMVEEIKGAKGYVSFSAVVHAAIIELYTKTFPNYMRPLVKDEDPASRLRRKAAIKEARAELFREDQLEIVKELGGTVVEDGGKEYCAYFTYSGAKRFEQKIPLQFLTNELMKSQYQPSRERVERLQREGKTD